MEYEKDITELISVNIRESDGQLFVGSRDIAIGLKKEHKDVLVKIREILNEREFSPISYLDSRSRNQEEYLLPKNSFILLMMNYNGYNDFKRAYIYKFDEMEKQLKSNGLKLPMDYPSALRALADKTEESQRLEFERDKAIRERSWISSKREASVMGKYGVAVKRRNKLDKKVTLLENRLNKFNIDVGIFANENEYTLPEFITNKYDVYENKNLKNKPKEVIGFYNDKELNHFGLTNFIDTAKLLDVPSEEWGSKLSKVRIIVIENGEIKSGDAANASRLIVKDNFVTRDGRLFFKWVFYGKDEDYEVSKYARTICRFNRYFYSLSWR